MTAWDRQVALRALAIAALAFVVTWLLTAATDEGGVAWSERATRALPLAPACAAVGTGLALARGRARGEALALEALGRAPWQRSAAAAFGGAAAAMIAAALLALSPTGARAFYPTLHRTAAWRYVEGGPDADVGPTFVDTAAGLTVRSDGGLSLQAPADEGAPPLPRGGRAAAALATAGAGVALVLIAARLSRTALASAALSVGTAVVASIVLFQAAAASRLPALLAPLPAMVLLAWAAWRYGSDSWRTTRR